MSKEKLQPSKSLILTYIVNELKSIAEMAKLKLENRKRSDDQIKHVQGLIYDLIRIRSDEIREEDVSYPMGNNELDSINEPIVLSYLDHEGRDNVVALFENIDWLKYKETEEGFIDAEQCEYFYALSMLMVDDVLQKISVLENEESDKSILKVSIAQMIARKAFDYGDVLNNKSLYEYKLDAQISEEENRRKDASKKATDGKYRKNREAKKLICEDWYNNRNSFQSSMKAAEHYKKWIEEKEYSLNRTKFSYEVLTVRKWILEYAKEKGIKW